MSNENKKRGLTYKLQAFMGSYKGKVLLNFAYSWGAAIVILGTLFKLTYLPGANIMLFVGMGTEVLVFFISAFDRPYKSYKWESVFPNLKISGFDYNKPKDTEGKAEGVSGNDAALLASLGKQGNGERMYASSYSGQQAIAPQQPMQPASSAQPAYGAALTPTASGVSREAVANSPVVADATESYLNQLQSMTDTLQRFNDATNSLTQVSDTLLDSYKNITDNSSDITNNSRGYVHQMESLNRNLSGLNTIYEIQLKSISSQIDTIDKVNSGLNRIREMYEGSSGSSEKFNEEAERMAKQIEELNAVYARMLQAMTVNMK